MEDSEELFLDFRLTVSAIQHCQVRSKFTHVYSDILPDTVFQIYILHDLDREHLRLNDLKCGAKKTKTHFILHTKLTECQTLSRSTKHFVSYTNNVLETPVAPQQIITRVREVEISFTCYYSNTGVVSSVGLEVKSKKIIFSNKGLGKFVLEMNIFLDNRYLGHYTKKDFPVKVPLRKTLYVKTIGVDTQDKNGDFGRRMFCYTGYGPK